MPTDQSEYLGSNEPHTPILVFGTKHVLKACRASILEGTYARIKVPSPRNPLETIFKDK